MEFKSVSGLEIKESDDGKSFTIEGYASIFGNIDSCGDVVKKGAFKETLKKRPNIKILWQHDSDALLSSTEDAKEDGQGLFISVVLSSEAKTENGVYIKDLIASKALDSFSIGYKVIDSEYNKDGNRLLNEVELFEVSLVTFPANEEAVITAIKADNIKTEREFEQFLRDAGFSRKDAKTITSVGFKDADNVQRDVEAISEKLDNLINKLS